MKKRLIIMIITGMIFGAAIGQESNPFFSEWNTPFQVPPFDKIKLEHYLPAFMEGMKKQMEEISALVSNPASPTFENTIVAYDKSGNLMEKVGLVFGNQFASQPQKLQTCGDTFANHLHGSASVGLLLVGQSQPSKNTVSHFGHVAVIVFGLYQKRAKFARWGNAE